METAIAENRISELGNSYPDVHSSFWSRTHPVRYRRLLKRPGDEFVEIPNYPVVPDIISDATGWQSEDWLAPIACTPSEVIYVSKDFDSPENRAVFFSHVADDRELKMHLTVAVDAFHKAVVDVQEEIFRGFQTQPTIRRLTNVYSPPSQPNLAAALSDLAEIESEARDAGYDTPSNLAISGARHVVQAMHRIRPLRYHIYPMPDGEVAIDGGERGTRIGVFCYPNGEVQYVGWVNGECVEKQSAEARRIPSDFLRSALSELEGE